MPIRSLLGLLALLVAASCAPPRGIREPAAKPVAITRAEASLLRRLALTPPDPSPATAAPPATAAIAARVGAPPFSPIARTADDAARAVECLTAAVYYEARSEPPDGQRAVAQVVLNRVRDRAFPASVCGVVYQRTATVCQFSFACDGSTDRPLDGAAWARSAAVARAAYAGAVYAPVGASTHFHTNAILPWWAPSLARIGRIGAHVFYGWRGAMADALTFRRGYAGIEPGTAPLLTSAAPLVEAGLEGVTIHRGAAAPVTVGGGITIAAGVRIHRGVQAPTPQGFAAVSIGPELDDPPLPLHPDLRADPI